MDGGVRDFSERRVRSLGDALRQCLMKFVVYADGDCDDGGPAVGARKGLPAGFFEELRKLHVVLGTMDTIPSRGDPFWFEHRVETNVAIRSTVYILTLRVLQRLCQGEKAN
jgi:hypothetical protein